MPAKPPALKPSAKLSPSAPSASATPSPPTTTPIFSRPQRTAHSPRAQPHLQRPHRRMPFLCRPSPAPLLRSRPLGHPQLRRSRLFRLRSRQRVPARAHPTGIHPRRAPPACLKLHQRQLSSRNRKGCVARPYRKYSMKLLHHMGSPIPLNSICAIMRDNRRLFPCPSILKLSFPPKTVRTRKNRIFCSSHHHMGVDRSGRGRNRGFCGCRAAQPLPLQQAHALRLLLECRRGARQRVWCRNLTPPIRSSFLDAAFGRHRCVWANPI